MRCIVIGSKELSCVILDELIRQNHTVPLVISRDDSSGMKVWHEMGHRSLKDTALQQGIDVLEGANVNDNDTLAAIREAKPDLILSCFWSDLFGSELLSIPPRGVFNFHTAYLPRNRGSRPIPWAMIKGDEFAGITLHKMLVGVDDGPMVAQRKIRIGVNDTGKSLYDKVMGLGSELVEEVVEVFGAGKEVLTPQDEIESTFQLRGEPHGGQYNYFWGEAKIDRFKRSSMFPPFQAYRQPPQNSQSGNRVSVIVSSLKPQESWNHLQSAVRFENDLQPYHIKSGGDKPLRKSLRQLLPKNSKFSYFPQHSSGLDEYYPILESLNRGGYLASISCLESLQGTPLKSQPFRYENGVLELPINCTNPSQSELNSQLEIAQKFSSDQDCTCYLHILLDERYSTEDHELFTKELSQQIQNRPLSLMSYGDVCEEFNTEYEDISA